MQRRIGVFWLSFILLTGNLHAAPKHSDSAYAGSARCAACHAEQYADWTSSYHHLAMQVADESTVLGDFGDTSFESSGKRFKFQRQDNKYRVRATGSDGDLRWFDVLYTFGVEPLQQYVVATEPGRYQVLPVAWDTRPEKQGGQRWFDVYDGVAESRAPGQLLHWSGIFQNWNSQCAACHTTGYTKNFSLTEKRFNSEWAESGIGCESCHGASLAHVLAKEQGITAAVNPKRFSNVPVFVRDPNEPTASAIDAGAGSRVQQEIDTCGHCHALRETLDNRAQPGHDFFDTRSLSLPRPPLYYEDGQIREEVFVLGSFLQSRMHESGVSCANCHDPHTTRLRIEGNALCAQCHAAEVFDQPEHHHHAASSEASQCVSCHMPAATFMQIDPRRDHSFPIPAPGVSEATGTPDVCTTCHDDKDANWAQTAIDAWYPASRPRPRERMAIARARGDGSAVQGLLRQRALPPLSLAALLADSGVASSSMGFQPVEQGLRADSPLERIGALEAAGRLPYPDRIQLAWTLLNDPVKSVRVQAARIFLDTPEQLLSQTQRLQLQRARELFGWVQWINAERPEAQMNLALLYDGMGEREKALSALNRAIEIAPAYAPAWLRKAERTRDSGDEQRTESLLREGLSHVPDSAALAHALGLSLVRQKNYGDALPWLESAAESGESARYVYVYAVALHQQSSDRAIVYLEQKGPRYGNDFDLNYLLAAYYLQAGEEDKARAQIRLLRSRFPNHPGVRELSVR